MLAGEVNTGRPGRLEHLLGVVELLRRESCETSPVWMMKSGRTGSAWTLAIASRKVARASALGGLLKPIWLSLSWTKLNGAAARLADGRGNGAVEADRAGDPAVEGEQGARPRPGHALEEIAAVVVGEMVITHSQALS